MNWTEENILNLAPDAGTVRRGKPLASTSRWATLGTDHQIIWGECKGSGSNPYLVQANLKTAKYTCTCPVRKKPCKHILGMLLLYAKSSANFKYLPAPEWISLHQVSAESMNSDTKVNRTLIKSDEELRKAAEAKAKRWQKRLELMDRGMSELELWLEDIVRQGLANVGAEKILFWDKMAAKMVDAKMPRLSSFLKETHLIIRQNADWVDTVVARLGELHLWVEAFQHRNSLPAALQEELFVSLGKTQKKSDIIAQHPKVADAWYVLAVVEDLDVEGRNYRKVWLQGLKTEKYALILDYSFGNVGYEEQYFVGTIIAGKLAYYSKNYNQRATFVQHELIEQKELLSLSVYESFEQVLDTCAQAQTQNPWLFSFPAVISQIRPDYDAQKQHCQLIDKNGLVLPVSTIEEENIWMLLSLSGGYPITIFGEWNGQEFVPYSIIDEQNQLVALS